MNLLVKRKQQWESKNYQLLQHLLLQSSDALMLVVVRAGQLISFLLFLGFLLSRELVAITWALIKGPQLVRQIAPGQYQERHEFELPKTYESPIRLL